MMRRLLALKPYLMAMVSENDWIDTVWSAKKIINDAAEITICAGSDV